MSQMPVPPIKVRVDPTNPGQFFACCGLLELADRLWEGAEGWFEGAGKVFCIRPEQGSHCSHRSLILELSRSRLTNTMTSEQTRRREELMSMPKKVREADTLLEIEKRGLDKLWRESPILLHEPFNLRLDWFVDERGGGDTFKTWAGQQSVFEIAQGMQAPIENGEWNLSTPENWLFQTSDTACLPFYFDSDIGGLGSDLDIGFSFDPLRIRVFTRPLLELAAFIGLQRFRPEKIEINRRFMYSLWFDPLPPVVSAPATCGAVRFRKSRTFEFRFLFRTKYLKSFLPGNPIERRST